MKKFVSRLLVSALLLSALSVGTPEPALAGPFEMGLRLYEQGEYKLAAGYFHKATLQDQHNANAHYYLADSYLRLNRLPEAQAEYQKILAIAPDSQAARMSRVGLVRLRAYLNGRVHESWEVAGTTRLAKEDRYKGVVEGDHYLPLVTSAGKITRWAIPEMPLKVWIERSPQGIRNFQPAFIAQVPRAMDAWMGVMDGHLSYEIVNSREEADIRVSWTNTIDTKGHNADGGTAYTAGIMVPRIRDEMLQYTEVKIATFDILGNPQTSDVIYAVAIHELGHALGLMGHSDEPGDIMYAQNQHISKPSQRDITTLRKLYSMAADLNNLPPSARKVDPNRAAELARRLDDSVKQAETRIDKDSSALELLNMGVIYFQKAKQLIKDDKPVKPNTASDPDYWFRKALTVTDEAIRKEPRDPRAYHKRSLINQELQNIPQALVDIEKAISFDRKEPEYFMLKSFFHARLGQVAESRAALSYYLQQKPQEADSGDVRMIETELAKHGGK